MYTPLRRLFVYYIWAQMNAVTICFNSWPVVLARHLAMDRINSHSQRRRCSKGQRKWEGDAGHWFFPRVRYTTQRRPKAYVACVAVDSFFYLQVNHRRECWIEKSIISSKCWWYNKISDVYQTLRSIIIWQKKLPACQPWVVINTVYFDILQRRVG